MKLDELLKKRLIFISGKGGVGKTSVAVLLAHIAAHKKKRVIIVEMNSTGRVAPLFGTDAEPGEEVALAPHISGINLSPKRCFEEFVLTQVRFRAIYETFFNNKYVTNFVAAIPGLNEILMLGKIWEMERDMKSRLFREKQYDLVIVDAPATGHGLSSLEVPNVLESAVKAGPLYKKAVAINELLADAEKTAMCLVTLAEEMPVTESIEFIAALRARTRLAFGPVFVNALVKAPAKIAAAMENKTDWPQDLEVYAAYYRLARDRAKLQKESLKVIDESFADFDRIHIPLVFTGLDRAADFSGLAASLSYQGSGK